MLPIPKLWIPWPEATIGQAVRNHAVIRARCNRCGHVAPLRWTGKELLERYDADLPVAALKAGCSNCPTNVPRDVTVGAFFPEGWVEDIKDWPRRRQEGL